MPRYEIDIEDQVYQWGRNTITLAELRDLAGYPADQQMIEVDLQDNTEVSLSDETPIELRPGKGFAKKVVFRRG